MTAKAPVSSSLVAWLAVVAAACGAPPPAVPDAGPAPDAGGDADAGMPRDGGAPTDAGLDGGPGDAGPTPAQRAAAAAATAHGNALCVAVQPFYWEVGDRSAALASGSEQGASSTQFTADTVMAIASASKWLYSTYYVQRAAGALTDEDIKFFNFRSGYTRFGHCGSATTVDACLAAPSPGGHTNGELDPVTENHFDYSGGHMQKHASLRGLGPLDEAGLGAELRARLGAEVSLGYTSPQLAGGVTMSAAQYAKVLRKIIRGELLMRDTLGAHPVCASAKNCPSALGSPAPPDEEWSYSIGHWVETDPSVGDGAFSSAGAFGFYPWVDAQKTLYGVLARLDTPGGAGFASVKCGRLIRKAYVTGAPQ